MLWVSLRMVCIGCLLGQTDSACYSQAEILNRRTNIMRKVGNTVLEAQPEKTCAKAAEEMSGEWYSRALSPWTYRLDEDQDRIPDKISMAVCLCDGCILNGKEDASYNSVPLTVTMLVYKKTECNRGENKYRLKRETLNVTVGCTCVMPKTAAN